MLEDRLLLLHYNGSRKRRDCSQYPMISHLTDDKDLRGFISGRLGFSGHDLFEELLEHPHEGLVILGAEHLGNKDTSFLEEFTGQLERVKRQLS